MGRQIVWTVHAMRYGNQEAHSYIVGVYGKKHAAIKAADEEERNRAGKYGCQVREHVPVNKWTDEEEPFNQVRPVYGHSDNWPQCARECNRDGWFLAKEGT